MNTVPGFFEATISILAAITALIILLTHLEQTLHSHTSCKAWTILRDWWSKKSR